ncbi:hypothetical protein SLEP1_g29366 [Rubroshorea leprosula]|uniref:Metallothionein n=1 Tax=Rubroshorea leprosula TaxID=152421 RepID=A0AAV5K361_9ROSI|nr:hypothetical protein SLEP1_g29366 [Rubroshorea leprosula]
MAATEGVVVVCDDRCGCPSPCPGGTACRCPTAEASAGGVEHKKCSCGEHCSCNPCGCDKTEVTGTGKVYCKCGPNCTCATCAA